MNRDPGELPESVDVASADFVFVGVVLSRAAATMDVVPLDEGTLVVGVTETISSPDDIGDIAGYEITVQLQGQTVEVQETYTFYADSWLFGDGLAVVCTRLDPYDPEAIEPLRMEAQPDPMAQVRQRTREADLVVSGRIVQVNEVRRGPDDPVTEHDPQWREAVIDVSSVEFSAADEDVDQVTIRFAGSLDADWAAAPKFSVSDTGVWLLGHTDAERAELERAEAGAPPDEYVVTRPGDAVAIENLDDVRELLQER
jgi:hypothetical protein